MSGQWMRAALAAALGLAVAGGAMEPAMAAGAPAAAATATLEADRQLVVTARDALFTQGYPALAPYLGRVKLVFSRAPEAGAVSPAAAEVYGTAAMILAMEANEGHRFREALIYGAKGLALTPDSSLLLTEMAISHGQLRQFDEALALIDGWLAAHTVSDPDDRSRLHRSRGFVLIELERLDEAEAEYRAALELEPSHQGAKDELAYIAGLRQGQARQGIGITTSDKSATEGAKALEETAPVED